MLIKSKFINLYYECYKLQLPDYCVRVNKYILLLLIFVGDFFPEEYRIKDEPDPDVRISQEEADKMVEPKNEFYDDEKDNDKEPVPEKIEI